MLLGKGLRRDRVVAPDHRAPAHQNPVSMFNPRASGRARAVLGCFLIDARFSGLWPHSGGPALVFGSSQRGRSLKTVVGCLPLLDWSACPTLREAIPFDPLISPVCDAGLDCDCERNKSVLRDERGTSGFRITPQEAASRNTRLARHCGRADTNRRGTGYSTSCPQSQACWPVL